MEKAKISITQLFVLILLFEQGDSMLLPLAMEVKQDSWISILLSTIGGVLLFLVYYRLYRYFPNVLPTDYFQKIVGKVLGKGLAFLYILYFVYFSARLLRSFGEILGIFVYPFTPLIFINIFMVIVVVYTVRKGIEVLSRTAELLFIVLLFLSVTGLILVSSSGLINIHNLTPVLENGISPILKNVFTETLYIPFGELIVFTMIFPYLNSSKKVKSIGVVSVILSGMNLAFGAALNIGVLGTHLASRYQFPLLTTMQSIQILQFLERLDVYFLIALIIGCFFKIALFFYAAVIGISDLFKIREPSQVSYPLGFVVLFLSIQMASTYSEQLQEELKILPLAIQLPFQVIIPILLLIIAFFKNKKNH
ncbi:GerAB/ArcD/ProY family transporter [Bacillus cihuensis]|uniref:GerAB/ArcD/ProY family transporter n=1 Tax=Bacillus cihuensis TaxID=1208599 RepID=UPI000401A097|nr:GerAB/ArcD/ProY family transporter [Bacillus cihuensis]